MLDLGDNIWRKICDCCSLCMHVFVFVLTLPLANSQLQALKRVVIRGRLRFVFWVVKVREVGVSQSVFSCQSDFWVQHQSLLKQIHSLTHKTLYIMAMGIPMKLILYTHHSDEEALLYTVTLSIKIPITDMLYQLT